DYNVFRMTSVDIPEYINFTLLFENVVKVISFPTFSKVEIENSIETDTLSIKTCIPINQLNLKTELPMDYWQKTAIGVYKDAHPQIENPFRNPPPLWNP
ncbi:MAG: hypothetical protein AAGG80_03070, partial [Pseudomonadota bacterium]